MDRALQKYVDELVDAGTLRPSAPEYGRSGYDSAFCISGKENARAIGEKVYKHGGDSAMLEVANATVARMGKKVQVELDYCWNGIGGWQS